MTGEYRVTVGDIAVRTGLDLFDAITSAVGWDGGRIPYKYHECEFLDL